MAAAKKEATPNKLIAENRRARFDYFLEDRFEAGIALTGSEVKSLRTGRANIAESYAAVQGDEIMLVNADIPPYSHGGPFFNHEPPSPPEAAPQAQGDRQADRRRAARGPDHHPDPDVLEREGLGEA